MILLDTCAIIWLALEPARLSKKARKAIATAEEKSDLLIADISWWEIAMLTKKGRLAMSVSSSEFSQLFTTSYSPSVEPISPAIAELSVNLDETFNNDPADRIIAATGLLLNASVVTADRNLLSNKLLPTIW